MTPFLHIASHVGQTPRVGRLFANRMSSTAGVGAIPRDSVEVLVLGSAKLAHGLVVGTNVVSCRCPRSVSIFPFCLGWEAIAGAGVDFRSDVRRRGVTPRWWIAYPISPDSSHETWSS